MTDLNTEVLDVDFLDGRLQITTLLDQGDRDEQQDSFTYFIGPDFVVLALADGMGGHAGGALASQAAVGSIREALESGDVGASGELIDIDSENAQQDLALALIGRASAALLSLRQQRPELKPEPDTTCVIAVIGREKTSVAHLGDSRCYFLAADDEPKHTKDHSLAMMLLQMGELNEAEAADHSSRHQLVKSVASGAGEADTGEHNLLTHDSALLLCSDGFWDHLKPDEIAQLRNAACPEETLAHYVPLILQRAAGKADNISAILARVERAEAV